jgi:hypothetical protein
MSSIFCIFSSERSNGTANWNTFHAAAGSVTMLYKGKEIDMIFSNLIFLFNRKS